MSLKAIADVIADRAGGELVDQWIVAQREAVSARPDLIREAELRDQSVRFVELMGTALAAGDVTNGGDAWDAVRAFVSEVSASRTRQGFTPTETAMFILSLKQPLFERLQRALASDSPALVRAIWDATLLLDQLGLHATEVYQATRDEVIRRQRDELIELSTPVIKIWDGILVLPLIGTLDSVRTQLVMESLLERICQTSSEIAIIDITGVATVDTLTAQHILKTVTATRLLGADCIVSGLRPSIAQTLVQLGVDMAKIRTKATLAAALAEALARTGRVVTNGPQA